MSREKGKWWSGHFEYAFPNREVVKGGKRGIVFTRPIHAGTLDEPKPEEVFEVLWATSRDGVYDTVNPSYMHWDELKPILRDRFVSSLKPPMCALVEHLILPLQERNWQASDVEWAALVQKSKAEHNSFMVRSKAAAVALELLEKGQAPPQQQQQAAQQASKGKAKTPAGGKAAAAKANKAAGAAAAAAAAAGPSSKAGSSKAAAAGKKTPAAAAAQKPKAAAAAAAAGKATAKPAAKATTPAKRAAAAAATTPASRKKVPAAAAAAAEGESDDEEQLQQQSGDEEDGALANSGDEAMQDGSSPSSSDEESEEDEGDESESEGDESEEDGDSSDDFEQPTRMQPPRKQQQQQQKPGGRRGRAAAAAAAESEESEESQEEEEAGSKKQQQQQQDSKRRKSDAGAGAGKQGVTGRLYPASLCLSRGDIRLGTREYNETDGEFPVEHIVDEVVVSNVSGQQVVKYLPKWEGYELDVNGWEPAEGLQGLPATHAWKKDKGKRPDYFTAVTPAAATKAFMKWARRKA